MTRERASPVGNDKEKGFRSPGMTRERASPAGNDKEKGFRSTGMTEVGVPG